MPDPATSYADRGLADAPSARPVDAVSLHKGLGYFMSTMSVVLLGVVSFKAATRDPLLLACLLLGMAASVAGMALRWHSHRVDEKRKHARGE